jgi:hypothetical protein
MIRRMLEARRLSAAKRRMQHPRIYFAARTGRQEELREIAEHLTVEGAEVTSRWLFSEPLTNSELSALGRAPALAQMDLDDLARAQVCIAFTEGTTTANAGRGGRHAELGIALGLGKRVLVVGPREHVFHCLPGIEHYPSWDEARLALFPTADKAELPRGNEPQAERAA